MLIMAWIFSGLPLIPLSEMRYPSSWPVGTLKEHFFGLSLML
jgi:hypothetical protein